MIIYSHLIYIDSINGNSIDLSKKLDKFIIIAKNQLR